MALLTAAPARDARRPGARHPHSGALPPRSGRGRVGSATAKASAAPSRYSPPRAIDASAPALAGGDAASAARRPAPQERVAARARAAANRSDGLRALLLRRARADLDAGRSREGGRGAAAGRRRGDLATAAAAAARPRCEPRPRGRRLGGRAGASARAGQRRCLRADGRPTARLRAATPTARDCSARPTSRDRADALRALRRSPRVLPSAGAETAARAAAAAKRPPRRALRGPAGWRRPRRSRTAARWWASSSATPSTEGTPITVRPAATGGGDAGRRVLERDDRGPGLDAEPPAGLQVGVGRRLRRRHFVGAEDDVEVVLEADDLAASGGRRRSGELETRPIGVPRSRSAASSSRAPIIASTPCSSSATTSAFSSSISSAARPGSPSRRSRMPPAIAAEVPTSSSLSAGVNSRPRRSKRSSSARVQTDSVSSRRPSLSKTTASGRAASTGGIIRAGLSRAPRAAPPSSSSTSPSSFTAASSS